MTTTKSTTDIDIKTLKGEKVTLMLINEMGFPVCRHIKIQKADIVSAKRYVGHMTDKKCLQLQYVMRGKRKSVATRYTENDLAIALGWQDVKTPDEFVSFDDGLIAGMTAQVENIVYTQQSR
jgi:hypothetical protein